MVWDLMRGIDMLLERPQIDPKRIVMLGAVAGGGDPAAVTAALDSRIAAGIPFNFGEAGPEEHYTEGPRPYDFGTADPGWAFWESTRNLNRSATASFSHGSFALLWRRGGFCFPSRSDGPRPSKRSRPGPDIRRSSIFTAGARISRQSMGSVRFPVPESAPTSAVFFDAEFIPSSRGGSTCRFQRPNITTSGRDAELMAITPELAAAGKPKTTAALASALARTRLKRARENPSSLRSTLAEKLGDIEPAGNPVAKVVRSRPISQFLLEAISLEVEPAITLPILLLKPSNGTSAPIVLAFAQEGKAGFLANRAPEIVRLLEQGSAVCLADVRGTGELTRRTGRGPGAMTIAANELMLASTLLGERVKDARTIFGYLSHRPGHRRGQNRALGRLVRRRKRPRHAVRQKSESTWRAGNLTGRGAGLAARLVDRAVRARSGGGGDTPRISFISFGSR
jgi:hypothetical protein